MVLRDSGKVRCVTDDKLYMTACNVDHNSLKKQQRCQLAVYAVFWKQKIAMILLLITNSAKGTESTSGSGGF